MESLVADLQHEWSHASAGKRGVILVKGYAAFWVAFLLCGLRGMTALDMATEDRRAVGRALAWALILGTAVMTALTVPTLLRIPARAPLTIRGSYVAYLIPQALPLAIPVGLTLGIIVGIVRPVSRSSTKVILAIATVCSIASFITVGWVMPVANQAFRSATSRYLGVSGTPVRGFNELTMGELRSEIVAASAVGEFRRARRTSVALHIRWVVASATLLLAALALALRNRYRTAGRIKLVAVTCGVLAMWWAMLIVGDVSTRSGVPPLAGIWLPNLALAFCLVFLAKTAPAASAVAGLD